MQDIKYFKGDIFKEELKHIAYKGIMDEVFDYIDCLKQYLALWQLDKPWKGYQVYAPYFYKTAPIIGLPYVVLVKDGMARLSTDEESLEYLNFVNNDFNK